MVLYQASSGKSVGGGLHRNVGVAAVPLAILFLLPCLLLLFYLQIQKSSTDSSIFYEYDDQAKLISAANENGRVQLTYTENGLPSEVRYSSGRTLYYGYNQRNQRTYIADNRGYNISYTYDQSFRLTEIRNSSGNNLLCQFQYENGLMIRKTLGNGGFSAYAYDSARHLTQLVNYFPNGSVSGANSYEYDKKGRVSQMTDSANQTWMYRYDSVGQLKGWTSSTGESIQYTYDKRGNRIVTSRGESVERYSVNNINQYTSFNGTDYFSYDMDGNLRLKATPQGNTSYEFDNEGRLKNAGTAENR